MQILQLIQDVLKILEKQHCDSSKSLMNPEDIHFTMSSDMSGMFYYEHHEDMEVFEEFSNLDELHSVINKYFK